MLSPGNPVPATSLGNIAVTTPSGVPVPTISPGGLVFPDPLSGGFLSTPPGANNPTANPLPVTVPLGAQSSLITLEDGQTVVPAPSSQLIRTVEQMLASQPRTSNSLPVYISPTPAELGSMVVTPPLGEFINTPQRTLAFELTGQSAAACAIAPCVSTCQVKHTKFLSTEFLSTLGRVKVDFISRHRENVGFWAD
jgi:hypothetical protein